MQNLVPAIQRTIEFLNDLNTAKVKQMKIAERSIELVELLSEELKALHLHSKLFESACTFYPETIEDKKHLQIVDTQICNFAAVIENSHLSFNEYGDDIHTVYIRVAVGPNETEAYSVMDLPTAEKAKEFERILRFLVKLPPKIIVIEYLLPDILAGYLINDDPTGLTEREIHEIDSFLVRENIEIAEVKEDSSFYKTNHLNSVGGNCSTFVGHKKS